MLGKTQGNNPYIFIYYVVIFKIRIKFDTRIKSALKS